MPSLRSITQIKRSSALFLALALIVFAPVASAGLTGVYELPRKDMQIAFEFLDEENIKVQIKDDFYLLVNGTKIYMINGEHITDVQAFSDRINNWKIVKFLEKRAKKRKAKMPTNRNVSITNRTETLGGITGTVWESRTTDPNTQVEEVREIVVTDDSRLMRLALAMENISHAQDEENTQENKKKPPPKTDSIFGDNVAILRYSNRFQLKSIKEAKLNPQNFLLPQSSEIKSMPRLSDLANILKLMVSLSND